MNVLNKVQIYLIENQDKTIGEIRKELKKKRRLKIEEALVLYYIEMYLKREVGLDDTIGDSIPIYTNNMVDDD